MVGIADAHRKAPPAVERVRSGFAAHLGIQPTPSLQGEVPPGAGSQQRIDSYAPMLI